MSPHAKEWWPDHLVDEMMPPGKADPALWLATLDSALVMVPGDDDFERAAVPVTLGEVLEFTAVERLGRIDINIHPGAGYSIVAGGTVPDGYTQVHEIGDPFMSAETLDDLVACLRDYMDEGEPGAATVVFSRWSDHRFRADIEDGRPVITAVAADGAA